MIRKMESSGDANNKKNNNHRKAYAFFFTGECIECYYSSSIQWTVSRINV